MEKIIFDTNTYLYKTKLNFTKFKYLILKECEKVIMGYRINAPAALKHDAYVYYYNYKDPNFLGEIKIKNKLDEILKAGIDACVNVHIWEECGAPFNKISTQCWVNLIKAKNPVQQKRFHSNNKFHDHVSLNKEQQLYTPHYTYVYYIQMPDNLSNDDGVLYLKGDNKEYSMLPEEGDLIIMKADMPHAPTVALNSSKDRIVLAGNVGLELI